MVSSSSKNKLDPLAVLRRASSVPGCTNISIPSSPLICSFLVGLDPHNSTRDPSKLARINVFTDTGTVSVGRLLHGNVRQIFRRNVFSLDTIEDLLRDPPHLTIIDESLIASSKTPLTAAAQFELADVGCAILTGEREKLQTHFQALDNNAPKQSNNNNNSKSKSGSTSATTTSAPTGSATPKTPVKSRDSQQQQQHTPSGAASSEASPSTGENGNHNSFALSGMEFQFSLPPDAMKDVDRCLTDIHSMGKLVRKVATNGRGTVFLYGNGGVAYTPQIPKALYHRLSQLRHSSYEHRPAYVSLGSRDRYYCSFHDGSYAFKGPKGLDRELKKAKKRPVSVAFGSTYDSFVVVFSDGSWRLGGRAIPSEFEAKLGQRRDVYCANLGPEGEWFIKLQNKKMWWGGVHSELEAAIQDLLESGHRLHFLDFGDEGSYFVSYD